MGLNKSILTFNSVSDDCVLAAIVRRCKIKVSDGRRTKCQRRQKKCNDQRALVARYKIKGAQSLGMKYYLVTGGFSSLVEPHEKMPDLCISMYVPLVSLGFVK